MALTPQNVVAWHNRTNAQHKQLLSNGPTKFRTLSLSLYGSTHAPLYAAVMVKRKDVIATKQVGPVNQSGMQQAFEDMADKGWGRTSSPPPGLPRRRTSGPSSHR